MSQKAGGPTSVQVWLNDGCSKSITVTPSTNCEDVIRFLATQLEIPKRTQQHLEIHVYVDGKVHSVVGRDEKIVSHVQQLASRGINIEDTNRRAKYVFSLNAEAAKKVQKSTPAAANTPAAPISSAPATAHTDESRGKSSSYFSLLKRRIGHQRSASLPLSVTTQTDPKEKKSKDKSKDKKDKEKDKDKEKEKEKEKDKEKEKEKEKEREKEKEKDVTPAAARVVVAQTPPASSSPSSSPTPSQPTPVPELGKQLRSPRVVVLPPPIAVPTGSSPTHSSPLDDEEMLAEEKMPVGTPTSTPHLTPRASISPPRATQRARSKTISQSLSSSDLSVQADWINYMISHKTRTRSSLSFDQPPLADIGTPPGSPPPELADPHPRSNRAISPPPPQRLYVPPPSITTPPVIQTRQRSYTTSTMPASLASTYKALSMSADLDSAHWLNKSHEPVVRSPLASPQKSDDNKDLLDVLEKLKKATA